MRASDTIPPDDRIGARRRLASNPLTDFAGPDLYRNNAFRILQLQVDATQRDVSRQGTKLKQMHELGLAIQVHPSFPLVPPPSHDLIRASIQKLQDPGKRLVDEFFWFWPEKFGASGTDPALQAIQDGQPQTAVALWGEKQGDPALGAVARHNLAIYWHLTALEAETHLAAAHRGADWRSDLDSYWEKALGYWDDLASDQPFWDRFLLRIRLMEEVRVTAEFGQGLRESLPDFVALIHGHLALRFAKAGDRILAAKHVQWMRTPCERAKDFQRVAISLLTPIVLRLREQMDRSLRSADVSVVDGGNAASLLAEEAVATVGTFDLICGETDRFRIDLFDEVARCCNQLLVKAYERTQDISPCLNGLQAVLRFTTAESLRSVLLQSVTHLTQLQIARQPSPPPYSPPSPDVTDPASSVVRVLERRFGVSTLEAVIIGLGVLPSDCLSASRRLEWMKSAWIAKIESALSELTGHPESRVTLASAVFQVFRGILLQAVQEPADLTTATHAREMAGKFVVSHELAQLHARDQQLLAQAIAREAAPKDAVATHPPRDQNFDAHHDRNLDQVIWRHFEEPSLQALLDRLAAVSSSRRKPADRLNEVVNFWMPRLNPALAELQPHAPAHAQISAAAFDLLRCISREAHRRHLNKSVAKRANHLAAEYATTQEQWNALREDREKYKDGLFRSNWKVIVGFTAVAAIGVVILYSIFARDSVAEVDSPTFVSRYPLPPSPSQTPIFIRPAPTPPAVTHAQASSGLASPGSSLPRTARPKRNAANSPEDPFQIPAPSESVGLSEESRMELAKARGALESQRTGLIGLRREVNRLQALIQGTPTPDQELSHRWEAAQQELSVATARLKEEITRYRERIRSGQNKKSDSHE